MASNIIQTQLPEDDGAVKAVEIYKAVLEGKYKKFPKGFFKEKQG